MAFRRVILVVWDSVGVGAMPDWQAYGDPPGADTLGNLARRRLLNVPNLQRLGVGNLRPLAGIPPVERPQAAFGRCTLASPGKDTTTGHWEIAGIHLERPFPLYPRGFPAAVMDEFARRTGRGWLGNVPASGTEIIAQLGAEHMRTGKPIVYTSADSVFQIAAHEDVIPLAEQYRICAAARALLTGEHEVGRVIARPFAGEPGAFRRTANRHDYAVAPPPGMLLDRLAETGVAVVSVGKISDVYVGRGVSAARKSKTNAEGMAQALAAIAETPAGLSVTNLVDFDMLYGHRNDAEGYSRALEEADAWIPKLEAALGPDDLAIFTADHGCDPTVAGTDHTREYVPLLAFGPRARRGVALGTRGSLSDIGQTVAQNFGARLENGTNFLSELS